MFFFFLQIPRVNLTYPDDASLEEIHELERTFIISSDNLTDNNATKVYVGLLMRGNWLNFTKTTNSPLRLRKKVLSAKHKSFFFVIDKHISKYYLYIIFYIGCELSDDLSNCTAGVETLYSYSFALTQCQEWDAENETWATGTCEVRPCYIQHKK